MSRLFTITMTVSVALIGPVPAWAEPPKAEAVFAKNAALTYWRAFALLPKMDDDQQESVADSLDRLGPVDKNLMPVIEASHPSLKELHRAAAMPSCDWGLAVEDGINAMMPHLSKARELSRMACLRAQLRFEQGRAAGAIEDATAVMALGRHAGADGLLISVLVDYAVERWAIELIAAYLPKLDSDALEKLSRKLDELPARKTTHDAILAEKEVFLGWFIRELRKEGGKEKVLQLFGDSNDPAVAVIKGLSRDQLLKSAIELRAFYDRLAEVAVLPPDKAKKMEADLIAGSGLDSRTAEVAKGLAPAVVAARQAEAVYQARLAMLKAAVAVAEQGRGALSRKEHQDPFGGRPFKYVPFDGGFELTSKLTDREGEPVSLAVGRRAAE